MISSPQLLLAAIVAAIAVVGLFTVFGRHLAIYLQCLFSDAHVGFLEIVGMQLRKTDVRAVLLSHIRLTKAGIHVPVHALETHYHAAGHVSSTATAVIVAAEHGKRLSWEQAASIDLSGKDVLEYARGLGGGSSGKATTPKPL